MVFIWIWCHLSREVKKRHLRKRHCFMSLHTEMEDCVSLKNFIYYFIFIVAVLGLRCCVQCV